MYDKPMTKKEGGLMDYRYGSHTVFKIQYFEPKGEDNFRTES
jgi:hypothetical protein